MKNSTRISKKILIVDNSAWTIYKFRLPWIKALMKQGYEVVVASPVDEFIHYLNDADFNKHIALHHLNRTGRNIFHDLFFLWELTQIIKKEKPALVISFTLKPNIYSGLVNQLLGIPTIAVVTGLGYTYLHQEGLFRWIGTIYKLAFRKIKKLIVFNQGDFEYFTENEIVPLASCLKIPGEGINSKHYLPKKLQNKGKQPFTFLYIGRLMKDKGIVELVEAVNILRKREVPFAFQVMGYMHYGNPSDISKDDLLSWVEQHAITYFGSRKDVRPRIASADALVLPSHREGLSRVVLEAMSMAKPVIVTDVPGCKDLVEHHQNGLLVPAKNPAALAEAMEYMTQLSPEQLNEMGQSNRKKIIAHFDVKVTTQQFLDVVREVLEEPVGETKKSAFRVGKVRG